MLTRPRRHPDLSQNFIKPSIQAFLRREDCDLSIIQQYDRGYCHGLAVLVAYCTYISCQPDTVSPCDNIDWLMRILLLLHDWDEVSPLSPVDVYQINRFLSLLESIQHVTTYFPTIGQGSLQLFLEDTRQRHLINEYSIAGLLSGDDFTRPIFHPAHNTSTTLIDEILKYQHRIILISCGKHTLSLFRHQNDVMLYNASFRTTQTGQIGQHFDNSDLKLLIAEIFKRYHYNIATPSPIGFRIYTFENAPAPYLSPQFILQQLSPPLVHHSAGNKKNLSALHIAALIGCLQSVNYYIHAGADPQCRNQYGDTPLQSAKVRMRHEAAAKIRRWKSKHTYVQLFSASLSSDSLPKRSHRENETFNSLNRVANQL